MSPLNDMDQKLLENESPTLTNSFLFRDVSFKKGSNTQILNAMDISCRTRDLKSHSFNSATNF